MKRKRVKDKERDRDRERQSVRERATNDKQIEIDTQYTPLGELKRANQAWSIQTKTITYHPLNERVTLHYLVYYDIKVNNLQ